MRRDTGISNGWTNMVVVIAIAFAMVIPSWTYAQEPVPNASPVPPVEVIEQPEQPPVDSEPEVPPADTGPAHPAQPDEPVSIDEEAPQPGQPVDPDPGVLTEPEPADAGTPEPKLTPTPLPTTAPIPVVTWNQGEPVRCDLADGEPAGLRYTESRTYNCEVSANVSSDISIPDDMEIEWQLVVDFADRFHLRFAEGSPAQITEELPNATATGYTIAHPWQQGSQQTLQFELVVTRTTCAVGEQVLIVQASPAIDTHASEVQIIRQDGNVHPDPARIVSPVIEADPPTVTFDGSITFEALSATAGGLESDISKGTATIVVTGEWSPCTSWTVNLSGAVDVPASTPAQFRVVSVENEPISGDACDLTSPCDVIVLPQTGDAATPLTYTIGLELQVHEFTPVGSFGIGLTSDVHGERSEP